MQNVKEKAKALGAAIAASDAVKEYLAAKAAYDASEALASKMNEYNACRMALGEERMKDTAMQDSAVLDKLEARIDALYTAITTDDLYLNLKGAQENVNLLMQEVNSDINFYAFGERPCTHDCSSCQSDCRSRK